jgi:hypothetical protein
MKHARPDYVAVVKPSTSHRLAAETTAPQTQTDPIPVPQWASAVPNLRRPHPGSVLALQRTMGNHAVTQLLARRRRSPLLVQRMISELKTDANGMIGCKYDTERPPGIIKDHEGDHSTPFITLQQEVVNAIAGTNLKGAWTNLLLTYKVYTSLPGWATSKASVQKGTSEWRGYQYNLPDMLQAGGDLDQLLSAANAMLALRNQIDLSAMLGKKKKGAGNAEGSLSAGLHHYEGKARGGADISDARNDIIYNMCLLFDHGRNDGRASDDLADNTWWQHCITVVSAYPSVAERGKITPKDLYPLRKKYSARWHELYEKG